MKYNKSEIMKRAWEIALNVKAVRLGMEKPDLQHGLEWAWKEAKESVRKQSAMRRTVEPKKNRYVELLDRAVMMGMNHGRSWIATARDIDMKQINPAWEGEEICYVYSN